MPAKKRAVTIVKVPAVLTDSRTGASAATEKPITKVWEIETTLEVLLKYCDRMKNNQITVIFEDEVPDPALEVLPGGIVSGSR